MLNATDDATITHLLAQLPEDELRRARTGMVARLEYLRLEIAQLTQAIEVVAEDTPELLKPRT